jgi:hypothetical protein
MACSFGSQHTGVFDHSIQGISYFSLRANPVEVHV